MKGVIQPDHIPVNKYQLIVAGLPPLTFTKISGIEEEVETVVLPDRTHATGGNKKAVEFTAMLPMHHTVEQAAMEVWLQEAQDPVTPTYKKAATLLHKSNTGNTLRTFTVIGLFVAKRKLPDLEMVNEGTMAEVEWSFCADQLLPV